MTAYGPSRHFACAKQSGRFWREADINWQAEPTRLVANDPEADLRRHAGIRDSNALNGKEAQDGFLIKARRSMTDFHRWL